MHPSNPSLKEDLNRHNKQVIAKGSLSFSMAAKFLPKASRDAVRMLYAWCRHADDAIDECHDQPQPTQLLALNKLKIETSKALQGQPSENPVFIGLSMVVAQYGIPSLYFSDLLEGMNSDLHHKPVKTEQEMRLYCYRVAGVVGLMFSHIVGVSNERALTHAVDLGSAMQMTNIARDIFEDAHMGRTYIPDTWLQTQGLTGENYTHTAHVKDLQKIAKRLVTTADELYRSGELGLRYLPVRTAFAVAAASRIYRAIGHKVLEKGPRAWQRRTWISTPQKLVCVLSALGTILKSLPMRLREPFHTVVISQTYRRHQ